MPLGGQVLELSDVHIDPTYGETGQVGSDLAPQMAIDSRGEYYGFYAFIVPQRVIDGLQGNGQWPGIPGIRGQDYEGSVGHVTHLQFGCDESTS
jgi:hypothetical protein